MNTRFKMSSILMLSLAACGSNSAADDGAQDGAGTSRPTDMSPSASASSVGILMTDAPANLALLASVNVTLDKVQVHVVPEGHADGAFDPKQKEDSDDAANDDGPAEGQNANYLTDPNDTRIDDDSYWQTVVLANSNFNLLALQGNITAIVGGLDLPAGVVTQIRVFVDAAGTNNVVLANQTVCSLDVSSVAAKGFKINEHFPHVLLQNGNTTHFTIDFDLANSLSQDGDCAYSLRPVFHLRGHDKQRRPDGGWSGQHSVHASGSTSANAGNGNVRVSGSGELQHNFQNRPVQPLNAWIHKPKGK